MINSLGYTPSFGVSPATSEFTKYAVMNHGKQVTDYLFGVEKQEDEKLLPMLAVGGGMMTSPWIARVLRHPKAAFEALKDTNALFKGLDYKTLSNSQVGKSYSNIFKTNRLMNASTITGKNIIANTKYVQNADEVKNALKSSIEALKEALKSGDKTKIAKYTGELESLLKSAKLPNPFVRAWQAIKGVNPKSTADILQAATKAGEKAVATHTAATAAKSGSTLSKIAKGAKSGGAIGMAVIEGALELGEIYNTEKELGTGAAVKQTAKSAVKVGASVGGWVAGAKGGAVAGGAIGTAICPGLGTAIGGFLGGLIGGFTGSWASRKIADSVVGKSELQKAKEEQSAKAAIELANNPQEISELKAAIIKKAQEEGSIEEAELALQAAELLEKANITKGNTKTAAANTQQPVPTSCTPISPAFNGTYANNLAANNPFAGKDLHLDMTKMPAVTALFNS